MEHAEFRVLPDKAQYERGDRIRLNIECAGQEDADRVKVILFTHQGKYMETETEPGQEYSLILPEELSEKRGGYLVKAEFYKEKEQVGNCYTAFDVADNWTQAPRYGFLCGFSKEDKQKNEYQNFFREMHLNVIQFYDWMYRHDDFYPEGDLYRDIMGREGSMEAVAEKIEGVHACGAKAIAYGAVYGAESFHEMHPECRYLHDNGDPMVFIDKIWLMDIHRGTAWRKKILSEYGKALKAGFDGVHMDQYGDPKEALVLEDGKTVIRDLADDFRDLINETKETYPEKQFIFNAVNNWPVDSVKNSRQDCVYIEVWPPNETYGDLYRLICHARKNEDEKKVILAAYLHPFKTEPEKNLNGATAQMAMATIFASGGYHLLLGEKGHILTEAYYPDNCQMGAHPLRNTIKKYYDFITAYGELLFPESWVDVTSQYCGGGNCEFTFTNADWSFYPEEGKVWIRIYKRGREFTLRCVNFTGISDMNWNKTHAEFPECVENLQVKVKLPGEMKKLLLLSPDCEAQEPASLGYEVCMGEDKRQEITFHIENLSVFSVVYLKLE